MTKPTFPLPRTVYEQAQGILIAICHEGLMPITVQHAFRKQKISIKEIMELVNYAYCSADRTELICNLHYSMFMKRLRRECQI